MSDFIGGSMDTPLSRERKDMDQTTGQQYMPEQPQNASARFTGPCCDNGRFERPHTCQKGPGEPVNGAGIRLSQLNKSSGRPPGVRGPLNSKHPSSMGRKFLKAGLDWQTDFALAIKNNKRERIKLWLRLLPYLVTTHNIVKVKKWKGRASKAALIALDALEGKDNRGKE